MASISSQQPTSVSNLGALLTDINHLGTYKIVGVDSNLAFPEPNFARLLFRSRIEIEPVAPIRFVLRQYRWTGSGIQNPPWISARSSQHGDLYPVRHGPIFSSGKFRAFLIDLGYEAQVEEKITVETVMQFVDEGDKFERFHSFNARAHLLSLSLSVTFFQPPANCVHTFRDIETEEPTESAELTSTTDAGSTTFTFQEQPARRGNHRLEW